MSKYQKEYLSSPGWIERAEKEKKEAGHKCKLCGRHNVALETHHNTYDNIDYDNPGSEPSEDLVVLCSRCHEEHEGLMRGFPPEKKHEGFEKVGGGESVLDCRHREASRRVPRLMGKYLPEDTGVFYSRVYRHFDQNRLVLIFDSDSVPTSYEEKVCKYIARTVRCKYGGIDLCDPVDDLSDLIGETT